jgi:hypothetical protein
MFCESWTLSRKLRSRLSVLSETSALLLGFVDGVDPRGALALFLRRVSGRFCLNPTDDVAGSPSRRCVHWPSNEPNMCGANNSRFRVRSDVLALFDGVSSSEDEEFVVCNVCLNFEGFFRLGYNTGVAFVLMPLFSSSEMTSRAVVKDCALDDMDGGCRVW